MLQKYEMKASRGSLLEGYQELPEVEDMQQSDREGVYEDDIEEQTPIRLEEQHRDWNYVCDEIR